MAKRLTLLTGALLAAAGLMAPTSSARAEGFRLLDPTTYFSSEKQGTDVVLTNNQAPIVAEPQGVYVHSSQPGCQECSIGQPQPVDHWLPGNCSHDCGCEKVDPYRDGWYLGISGGTAKRERVHEMIAQTTFMEFDMGFAANAFIGYRFHRFRLEAEGTYMNTEVNTAGAGGLVSDAVGNVNLKALMFNAYHDFKISSWKLSPYLGAGVGVYQSQLNSLYPAFFTVIPGFGDTPVNTTSDVPMAWQLMAGLTYPIGDRTEFFTGYRYFRGDTLTFASAPFASPTAPEFNPNGAIVHNVEFGLRVKF